MGSLSCHVTEESLARRELAVDSATVLPTHSFNDDKKWCVSL